MDTDRLLAERDSLERELVRLRARVAELESDSIPLDAAAFAGPGVADAPRPDALQRQWHLARFAVDNAGETMLLLHESGEILEANATACERLGFRRTELIGRQIWEIDAEMTPHAWVRSIASMPPRARVVVTSHHAPRSGDETPVETIYSVFEFDGVRYVSAFSSDISSHVAASAAMEHLNQSLEEAYEATLEGWSRALDLRDNETEFHSIRVRRNTVALARSMGVPDDKIASIRRGALLHDIGKIAIPDRILHKPGPLDDEEWEVMRRHPDYARELLRPIAYLQDSIDIPYCHHEKWDGTGYPRGLRGEEIPLAARIFAVVDVYDALRSDRPYRSAWPKDQVLDYIRDQSGIHFDPSVVDAFLRLVEQQPASALIDDRALEPPLAMKRSAGA